MQITPIVSRSNALIKKIRKLRDKKYREQFGEYVAEGKRWVSDALRICPQNVVAVLCSSDTRCEYADFVIEASLFAELADTENSQGVIAVMRIPTFSHSPSGNHCLFLDRVRDPGNMGTIIRTAVAAGYTDIVLRDCVDVFNSKVIRSSMTGILSANLHFDSKLSDLKECGYTVVAADLQGENIFETDFAAQKVCLVIGNEANGIDPLLLQQCDKTVTIPMEDEIESLNAAVSAGILMYQLKYRNR